MAFYLSGIGMLLFWETRRKDFWVMMTHHFATLTLIGFSYWLKCAPPATNSPSYSRALDVSGRLAWRRFRISSANLALWGSRFKLVHVINVHRSSCLMSSCALRTPLPENLVN